ncbi:MAG: MtnX-like HAD-IB family phosphatase [Stygiobacter sp.]|jgi:2,3-diketo-5-methylthio-1-phosphopentane phosphatase|uniref:MtnX-like HAD-IB family phosphatase n=1 Tax=Stygiobacter electus TaxID=3032292 RepID=A0AAE3NZ36_9BACT|nr:MtnX-like HAD-IB family phosphatase [Stygiobacter electus]MDF1610762.1 MtnX-like HAD-IB family phosphatase [Stygiobacter electus]
MNHNNFKIFVDFDGTISKEDVGEKLFIEFGNPDYAKKLIDDWNNDLVDPKYGWLSLCESVKYVDENKLIDFLSNIEIDSTFADFIKYCDTNNFDVKIVSDGFDFYINKILEKENIYNIEVSSNKLEIIENKFYPSFPNSASDCSCSANCKRNFIITNSSDDDYSVYIGDGVSDRCPVQYCDFIFAKNTLLKYCEVNRITYFPFNDFNDITKKLDELKNKKRLKKRHQAQIKRNEVYMKEA